MAPSARIARNKINVAAYIGAGIITPGAGGGGLPADFSVAISKTSDGSVGQTRTATPSKAGTYTYQWFRRATNQDIPGATSQTYVAQAADVSGFNGYVDCRVTKAGMQPVIGRSLQPVLDAPLLIDDFAVLADYTSVAGAQLAIVGGDLQITEPGAAGRAYKANVFNGDIATLGVISILVNNGQDVEANTAADPTIQLSKTTGFGGTSSIGGAFFTGQTADILTGDLWSSRDISENATLAALGSASYFMSTATSNLVPLARKRTWKKVYGRSKGVPTWVPTFDDSFDTQYTGMHPFFRDRNMKASLALPWDIIGTAGRLSLAMVQELYAYGHAMILDGSADDGQMNISSNGNVRNSPADNVAELNRGRAWLLANGLVDGKGGDGRDAGVYPNGWYEADRAGKKCTATAVVCGDGNGNPSTTITLGGTVSGTPLVGAKASGYQVPANTTVVSVSGTTVVVSNAIPQQTTSMSFTDTSDPYYTRKLQAALAAAGFKFFRTGSAQTVTSRFGADNNWLLFPGAGNTGLTAAQQQQWVQTAMLRGATVVQIWHQPSAAAYEHWDWMAGQIQAGNIVNLTVPELIARDYANTPPV